MANKELVFAGGCFWGVQAFARRLPGVLKTKCGYTNGTVENPSYEQVCTGSTGHAEAVKIQYDNTVIPLDTLAEELFTILHVTAQAPSQYRSGFYYQTEADGAQLFEVFKAQTAATGTKLAVELKPLTSFFQAEDYHQDYLEHHPDAFCHVDLSRFSK